jgi:hypothetical protein
VVGLALVLPAESATSDRSGSYPTPESRAEFLRDAGFGSVLGVAVGFALVITAVVAGVRGPLLLGFAAAGAAAGTRIPLLWLSTD